MSNDTDSRRFSGGKFGELRYRGQGREPRPIEGDFEPFDPSPWLTYPAAILWGSNHFGSRLPVGTTLVWLKKPMGRFGSFLSDAEVAWQKGGHGVYATYWQWEGCCRPKDGDDAGFWHPNQKPVGLMQWCISRLPSDLPILDPYTGSGTTLLAARRSGRRAIGIELDEAHCEAAAKRLSQGVLNFGALA